MAVPNELIVLGAGYVLLFVGISIDKLRLVKYMGAILLMTMGVYTLFPGYAGINHEGLVGLSLGTISIALGFFYLLEDSFSFDKQVETFDQHDDGRLFNER